MLHINKQYIQNITYLVGTLVVIVVFIIIDYVSNHIAFDNIISTNFILYLDLISKNVIVWLIPAVIIDWLLKRKPFYSIGLNFDKFAVKDFIIGTIIALLTVSLITLIDYNVFWNSFQVISELTHHNILSINALLTINDAITEELIWRGFIFQNLYRIKQSHKIVLISSLLFSIFHINQSYWTFAYLLNSFIVGILLCQMYIITKSLWTSIAFHSIWNILTTNIFSNLFDTNPMIEFSFITTIILTITIVVVNFVLKPSYIINRYFLITD